MGSAVKSAATCAPNAFGIPSLPDNLKVGPIAVNCVEPVLAKVYTSNPIANLSPSKPLYPTSQEVVVPRSAEGVPTAWGIGVPLNALYP